MKPNVSLDHLSWNIYARRHTHTIYGLINVNIFYNMIKFKIL